ncbi:MAG: hypothetical protein ACREQV_17985 [Candidatus Binatia bacterium]
MRSVIMLMGAVFLLRLHQLMLLEEVMYPMRRGIENKKQKRNGNGDAGFALALK